MSPRLTRLIGQTGLYAVANAAIKASGLFIAPILLNTAFLSQAGYGQLEVLLVTAQLGIVITGMGIGWGLLKYLTDPSSKDDHAALPFTSLLMIIVCASLSLAIFVGGAPVIDRLLFGGGELTSAIRILGAYIFVKSVGQIPYMVLRAREHVGSFVSIVVVEVVALVGLVYVFLVVRGAGLHGVLYAYLLAAATGLLLLIVFVLARIDVKLNRRLVKRIFLFGAPLVAAHLADHVLKVGDRYILNWLTDPETVALYGWAGRLSNALNLVLVQSLQMSFVVLGLKSLGAGDVSLHRRTFRHFSIWMGWGVLALSLLALDGMHLLVNYLGVSSEYLKADPLIYPLSLGFLAYGAYLIVVNVLYAQERTRLVGVVMLVAAVLNVLLNFALIPFFGMMGAAAATVLAYFFLALYTARIAEREANVGYPLSSLGVVVAVTAVMVLVAQPTADWAAAPRIAARLGLVLAYPLLVFLLRLYTLRDVREGARMAGQWWVSARGRDRSP